MRRPLGSECKHGLTRFTCAYCLGKAGRGQSKRSPVKPKRKAKPTVKGTVPQKRRKAQFGYSRQVEIPSGLPGSGKRR